MPLPDSNRAGYAPALHLDGTPRSPRAEEPGRATGGPQSKRAFLCLNRAHAGHKARRYMRSPAYTPNQRELRILAKVSRKNRRLEEGFQELLEEEIDAALKEEARAARESVAMASRIWRMRSR